jgi:hypothetical protein
MSGHLHAPATLCPVKEPGTHWIKGWVDPRVGLDNVEERKFLPLPGLEIQRLACRASRYPDYAIPARDRPVGARFLSTVIPADVYVSI